MHILLNGLPKFLVMRFSRICLNIRTFYLQEQVYGEWNIARYPHHQLESMPPFRAYEELMDGQPQQCQKAATRGVPGKKNELKH